MMPLVSRLLAGAAVLVLVSACSTKPSILDAPLPARSAAPVAGAAAGAAGPAAAGATSAVPQSGVATVDLASRSAGGASAGGAGAGVPGAAAGAALLAAPSQRVVYFDFDSFAIRSEFNALIDAHAKVLAANPSRGIVIEGHTDERGGREYNLALGQKRAEAVMRSLALLGAGERQIEAVSFGKERPADPGNDENAWARNRRAELKDR